MADRGHPALCAGVHHSQYPPERVAAQREGTVSVCLPARNEAATIGPILDRVLPLVDAGVLDQVVVVDDSTDGTAEIARARGAEVHRQADLRPELGSVLGKGDAMWRALEVLHGDVVAYMDADSRDLGPHFVCGLVGPLVCAVDAALVKGFYRRPFDPGSGQPALEGGGRVTELTARPLLAAFYPELATVHQPLAGEVAARRELLESLPFTTGYGVDVGLLIDAYEQCGIDAIAQVDLDQRQNRHRPLGELGPMAAAVVDAILSRVPCDGVPARRSGAGALGDLMPPAIERPPAALTRRAAA